MMWSALVPAEPTPFLTGARVPWIAQGQADDPKPKPETFLRVDLNLGRYGTGVDRLGFEPRTSCLQSRRSSADLPARRAHSVAAQMKLSAGLPGPIATAIHPERTSLRDIYIHRGIWTSASDGTRVSAMGYVAVLGGRGVVGASRPSSTLMSEHPDDGV